MDSNKDFVRIDEVFQKLRQTPYCEANSEAAWSRMKELLDEEIPMRPKNIPLVKRKYFYPLLLLLASAGISGTVWGYKVLNTSNNQDVIVRSISNSNHNNSNQQPSSDQNGITTIATGKNANKNSYKSGNSDALSVASLATAIDNAEPKNKDLKLTAPKTVNQNSNNRTAKNIKQKNSNNIGNTEYKNISRKQNSINISNNAILNPVEKAKTPYINQTNTEQNYTTIHQSLNPSSIIDAKKGAIVNGFSAPMLEKYPTSQQTTSNSILDNTQTDNILSNSKTNIISSKNDNFMNNGNGKNVSNKLSIDEHPKLVMQSSSSNASMPENERVLDGQKFFKDENGQWYKESKRIIPVVNKIKTKDKETNTEIITEVGNSTMFVMDRLPADELEIVKLTAIDKTPTTTTVEINNYSAISSTTSNSISNLKILNENKVKTIQAGAGQNFNNNLKALRDDIARFFQNSDKLQAAINFGGLYTPSGTGGYGLNLGLSGTYLVSERIHLTLEARYVFKTFTNFYIEDVNKQYNVAQNGNIFNGTEKVTNQEYLISGISMFEMPLYLTYNIGERLSIFGGLQFAYAAPIKWTSSTQTVINENYANTSMPIDKAFKINDQKDFAAQTGLGYTFGIGFDVSKKMSLDFRVNQNFKNNAASDLSNSVNNIFTTPTFNINIGFWFGKKEKIYYLSKR